MLRKMLLIALLCVGIAHAATPPNPPTTTPAPAAAAPAPAATPAATATPATPAKPAAAPATTTPAAPAKPAGLVEANAKYTEGKEYKLLPATAATQPTAKALLDSHVGKVEVINFFSYGCPVCNRLEPDLEKWNESKKASQMVAMVDVPVDWDHAGWENLARSFYIAETLNVLEKEHLAMFKAVHEQGKTFKDQAALQEFFITDVGVPRAKFDETFDSFNVRRRMKQGELLRNEYAVMAIPAFVVNGKYYIDVQTAGGMKQALDVLDYLVNKESFTKGTEEIKFGDVAPTATPMTTAPTTMAPSTAPSSAAPAPKATTAAPTTAAPSTVPK